MPKYRVTIKRSVWTDIEVEAQSGVAARALVEKYGPTEAANDFKVLDERARDTVLATVEIQGLTNP